MKSMENNLNDLFDYDYKIYQNDNYFKFSIDSVLLAEFVKLKANDKKILDLCTGNAAIPMILNTKKNGLDFTGYEIQKEIYDLAENSLNYNNINNVNIINSDINDIDSNYHEYDIVTCNPPYFEVNNEELINDNMVKSIARHEIKTNLENVISIAAKMTKNQGYFYMVHRSQRIVEIVELMNKYKFGVKRLCFCYNDHNSDSCFVLVEGIYNGKNYVKVNKPIFIKDHLTYKNIFEEE